jgi:hypothetical protein
MIAAILAIAIIAATPAHAEPQTRLYDARGNSIGTAVPQGEGSIRYYDSRGNSLGTTRSALPSGDAEWRKPTTGIGCC